MSSPAEVWTLHPRYKTFEISREGRVRQMTFMRFLASRWYVRWGWAVLNILGLSLGLRKTMGQSWLIVQHLSVGIVAQSLAVLVVVGLLGVVLAEVCEPLQWSWLKYCAAPEAEESGSNVNLSPMKLPLIGPAFIVLVALNIPVLARIEEHMFRDGTLGWYDGIPISIFFGLIHCLVGVPIAAGLALGVAGLWFQHQYLVGGVERSTLFHASHNLIIMSIILIGMAVRTFRAHFPTSAVEVSEAP